MGANRFANTRVSPNVCESGKMDGGIVGVTSTESEETTAPVDIQPTFFHIVKKIVAGKSGTDKIFALFNFQFATIRIQHPVVFNYQPQLVQGSVFTDDSVFI